NITITGTLIDTKNTPILQAPITITINGNTYTTTTKENGIYEFIITANKTGQNNITVTYTGNQNYNPTTANTTTTITKENTRIMIYVENTCYNENSTITVRLIDKNNNPISNATISVTINKNAYDAKTSLNGDFTKTIQTLIIGTNNITAAYDGNRDYNPTTSNATFNVTRQNTRITVNATKNTKLRNNITVTGTLTDKNNNPMTQAQITININGNTYTTTTNNEGRYTYTTKATKTGQNNITATYNGNQYYEDTSAKSSINVNKIGSTITVNGVPTVKYYSNLSISGKLMEENGSSISSAPVKLFVNNREYSVTTDNEGKFSCMIQASSVGVNNVSVRYPGNENYQESGIQTTFTVAKLNSRIILNQISSVKYGQNVTVTGRLVDENDNPIKDSLSITLNDKRGSVTTTSTGTFTYTATAAITGQNNVSITYNGNNVYQSNKTQANFSVNREESKITITPIQRVVYLDTVTVMGKLADKNNVVLINKTVIIKVNNREFRATSDSMGRYALDVEANSVGINNVTVTFNADDCYTKSTSSMSFTVDKRNTILTMSNIGNKGYGENIIISGFLKDNLGNNIKKANITLVFNGNKFTATTNDYGMFSVETKANIVGTNNITVTFNGNANYDCASLMKTVNVKKQDLKLSINKIGPVGFGDNVTVTGQFSDANGKILGNSNVKISINGNVVTVKTNKNGVYNYTYKTRIMGTNNITVSYPGNKNYNEIISKGTFFVERQNLTIILNSISAVAYGDNVTVTGKFTDKTGKLLGNSVLKLSIGGKTFNVKTNKNGEYSFTTRAGKVGTNTVTLSYAGNARYNPHSTKRSFNVRKQGLKISVDSIREVGYGDNVIITGKFTDKNGKLLGNSIIRISINGKIYKTKTNTKGIFNCSIRTNKIGLNNVTVSYPGNDRYNSISIKSSFNVRKQDVKISIDSVKQISNTHNITVSGKFTDVNGRLLKNSNVIIRVNNVKHIAKTDSAGVFRISVNARTGMNNITASYAGNSNYNSVVMASEVFEVV
ncbi:MAG: hypothetical protein BZ138_03895, partial [Methanosphaera sp. rholeuAM270]